MSQSHDAIRRVIEAFERSDWAEIDVRSGDLRVHLRAGGRDHPTSAATAAAPSAATVPALEHAERVEHDVPTPAPPELDAAHLVTAPSPGIFWCSPAPGMPPFAAVGDRVEASTTLCIVEVMKLMSHLKAGVGGQVIAIYGRNGERVQKGEPLFAIAPDGQVA